MPGGHCHAVRSYNYYNLLYKLLLLFLHAIPCGHWNAAHREGPMYLTPRLFFHQCQTAFPFLSLSFLFLSFFFCLYLSSSFLCFSIFTFLFLCSSICFAPAERLRVCCKKEGKKQNMAFGADEEKPRVGDIGLPCGVVLDARPPSSSWAWPPLPPGVPAFPTEILCSC